MLVLDANILVRAVLGRRVKQLLGLYAGPVELRAPRTAFDEAAEHLPAILRKRGLPERGFTDYLALLPRVIAVVEAEAYVTHEAEARRRLTGRDEEDWPVLAAALSFDCPIWTEDVDFFGCGVPTWTTDRVETYLAACAADS